ncbi:MAG: 2-iminoacetate synthase ThiH [Fusobacterium periodonticum]|nr:2-iminoacetate synthase ThiH [Fusobacterium periodonticum]
MELENINSDIMDRVISEMNNYDYNLFIDEDIKEALNKDYLSVRDFQALLSPKAMNYLEEMAEKAKECRERYFGNSVYIFTPLYISNYCDNYCVYCGFNSHNKIKRARLDFEQIEQELKEIAKTGLEEILILTGESERYSSIEYIGEACKLARKYFNNVGIEIYPVNVEDYKYLNSCGVDYVTIFQETYNNEKYKKFHLEGHKKVFSYRFNSQERALIGNMRGVALGALLGLDDFRKDAFSTGYHAYLLQKKYPHAEISISCPRLRPVINNIKIEEEFVSEKELFQIICAYRLFLPFANITISTRENPKFRDNVIKIAATKISAGVDTGIGAHSEHSNKKGDEQFEIADRRTVSEIFEKIKTESLQPVMNDYIYLKD